MAAPEGNRFWEARSSHGRKPIFETAEDLWNACVEYFAWVEENPLYTTELVKYQGSALFLDIDVTTWKAQAKRSKDFSTVVTRAEGIIYDQKFSGAAADLLNANIIARDLGLADKREHTGNDGGPIKVEGRTWRDVLRRQ